MVLGLNSGYTARKVMDSCNQDFQTQVTMCYTLYFQRLHLFAVNYKGRIPAEARIKMLWSSLVYFLHMDGVHILTKRNWILGVVPMIFMMMRADVMNPSRLTSEPNEHVFGQLRTMDREFTVNKFVLLVEKLERRFKSILEGKLKSSRDPQKGYAATFDTFLQTMDEAITGPVTIVETDKTNNEFLMSDGDHKVASKLWEKLVEIINQSNTAMERLLTGVFAVKEKHEFLALFQNKTSPKELLERINNAMTKTDSSFKKETRRANQIEEEENDMPVGGDDNANGNDRRVDLRDKDSNELMNDFTDKLVQEMAASCSNAKEHKEDGVEILSDEEDEPMQDESMVLNMSKVNRIMTPIIMKSWDEVRKYPKATIEALEEMEMKEREVGSANKDRKMKSLEARWFNQKGTSGSSKDDTSKEDEQEPTTRIQRGTIISSQNDRKFLVLSVFSKSYNKWYMSANSEAGPVWPPEKGNEKKHRVGIREVIVTKEKDGSVEIVKMKPYEDVVDGRNVRASYKLINDLTQIKSVHFNIDI